MSIRTYNKDHLKEHAGVSSVPSVVIDSPESSDPLVFWTKHETEPAEVNLHPFSTGQEHTSNPSGGGSKFIPFTGRPNLILQLAPAIKEALLYAAVTTVKNYLAALRAWWRILDSVEALAAANGQIMARVDDVRLLTQVHGAIAHSNGLIRQRFATFRSLVDTTRIALGERQTFWESPEDQEMQKHIPPKEQRDAVRFAVRNLCRSVVDRWAQYGILNECDMAPKDPQEFDMWRDVKYMRNIQKATGKTLPTANDVKDVIPPWALNTAGTFRLKLRDSVFPNHWEADVVWHQCLLNTGWNPSTLTTLDVSVEGFLVDHFKDDTNDPHKRFVLSPRIYELVGKKARAGGKEQFVTGQWKSLDGPGHLIKTYLKRVEPLREVLKMQLKQEQERYSEMKYADYDARTAQFAKVKNLQQGVSSLWLYVDRHGKVDWINGKNTKSGIVNGVGGTFLDEVIHLLNTKRLAINTHRVEGKVLQSEPLAVIPNITAKDFRVWFADYVYRTSRGNMLHVKRALNHSRLGTSKGYVNTNILNLEASDSARRFLNILVGELDTGRVDLTILAHLHRYGKVTPELQKILDQARNLPKSRMKVGCKDTRHPPTHIKASVDQDCDVHRCLLCQENAVLLPESLDGIAMRTEELRALQGFLPIETWIEGMYDIELKNNISALRNFDLNQCLIARKKWALAIAAGEHYVPGLPLSSSLEQMEMV